MHARLVRVVFTVVTLTTWLASTTGCGAPNKTSGTMVYSPSLTYSRSSVVDAARPTFPTGAPIVHRKDIEAAIQGAGVIKRVVVIASDNRTYVAVKFPSGQSLTDNERDRIREATVLHRPETGRILITTNPNAYYDFVNYARYLDRGRNFQGMLLSWRSIIRTTFGVMDV